MALNSLLCAHVPLRNCSPSIVLKWLHGSSWFLAYRLPWTYLILYFEEIGYLQKIRLLPSGTLVKLWTHKRKFVHGIFTIDECSKQVTVISLMLTIFGYSGCGQMLSTVNQQLSPVDHTQHAALHAETAIGSTTNAQQIKPVEFEQQWSGRLDVTYSVAWLVASAEKFSVNAVLNIVSEKWWWWAVVNYSILNYFLVVKNSNYFWKSILVTTSG